MGRFDWKRHRRNLKIYGIALVAVGILCLGYSIGLPVYDHRRSQSWAPTAATITRLDQRQARRSTKYDVEFTYDFAGERYHGYRFSVVGPTEEIYSRLKAARDAGQTVTCYVNPDEPSESVLDRDLHAGLLMGVLASVTFLGAGTYLLRW